MHTNKLKSILLLFAVMLTNVVVTSCDPEPEPPTPPSPEPEPTISGIGIKTPMEKKLVSVLDKDGDGSFFMYDQNYLTAFGDEYETFLFKDYKFSGYDREEDLSTDIYDITTNSDGFITSFKLSMKDKEGEFEMQEEYSFTYSDRHLTKKVYSYSGVRNYNEEFSGYQTSLFTWTEGNLIHRDETWAGYEGNGHWAPDISYGNQLNKYKQYTSQLAEEIVPSEVIGLALVGLFGDGPEYLPIEYSNYQSHKYNYKLNDDGYIAEETSISDWSSTTIYYTYADRPSNIAPRPAMPVMKDGGRRAINHKSFRKHLR